MSSLPYKGCCDHPMDNRAPALEASHLWANYPGGKRAALKDISFSVQPGTRVALVGPNGAGKSTILKAAAGLLPIDKGKLTLFGHAPGACQHQVVYLPQRGLIDWTFPINVRKLVLTGRYVHLGWLKRPSKKEHVQVDEALKLLHLSDIAERPIGQLSGGQQQRALLARALVHNAKLLLLDEPLNAVDQDTRNIVDSILDKLKKEGKTVVMATHDVGRHDNAFDDCFFLSNGERIDNPPGAPHTHD